MNGKIFAQLFDPDSTNKFKHLSQFYGIGFFVFDAIAPILLPCQSIRSNAQRHKLNVTHLLERFASGIPCSASTDRIRYYFGEGNAPHLGSIEEAAFAGSKTTNDVFAILLVDGAQSADTANWMAQGPLSSVVPR